MLGSSDNKPGFLGDRGMDQAIKVLLKKFPQYDSKASQVQSVYRLPVVVLIFKNFRK